MLPPGLPRGGANLAAGGDFGGGGNIQGGGFGGGGGMDPWQQSVENRIGKIEDRLGSVETQLATLNERVSHLPTKGWAVTSLILALTVVAALIGYGEKIQALLGQEPSAIESSANDARRSGGPSPKV